jgi:RecJ-like exonuclease
MDRRERAHNFKKRTHEDDYPDEIECPDCKGKGKIAGVECDMCQGTGKIVRR